MDKSKVLGTLNKNEDSIVTLYSKEAFCCTINFSTPYIKNFKRKFIPGYAGKVLVFSWTDNKYRLVDPKEIHTIVSLESILNNKNPLEECTNEW